MNKENVLFRVFKPVQEKLELPALNFQPFAGRRRHWPRARGLRTTYKDRRGTKPRIRPRAFAGKITYCSERRTGRFQHELYDGWRCARTCAPMRSATKRCVFGLNIRSSSASRYP